MKRIAPLVVIAALAVASCGGGDDGADTSNTSDSEPAAEAQVAQEGLVLVAPGTAAATIENPPENLVILDVRTPEEFAEGHIDGAVMIDFYRDDFAVDLAALDRDVPYVLYCRSGNRSGQTLAMMEQLGFTSVQDVDGGILAWEEAGLPTVAG